MKKIILLTACLYLLFGVTFAMADSMPYDNIIAYGTIEAIQHNSGNISDATITYIYQTYVDPDWDGVAYAINNVVPFNDKKDVVPGTDMYAINICKGNTCYEWDYAIVATHGSGDRWYLFENTHNGDYGYDEFWLVTPENDSQIYARHDLGDGNVGDFEYYTFFVGSGNTKFDHLDITIWTPDTGYLGCEDNPELCNQPCDLLAGDCDGSEVPEPGSILLLGTGILGISLIARRKLSKK